MLIHIVGSKSGFRDDFGEYDGYHYFTTETIILRPFLAFFGQAPLRNSIAMAAPKIPGDQKNYLKGCVRC